MISTTTKVVTTQKEKNMYIPETFIYYLRVQFGISQQQSQTFIWTPPSPSASEITASQPQSRDAVCLVIWWLIPCLFPTNLFPDKGVASTLVNMGASADCQTGALVEEMVDREKKTVLKVAQESPFMFCHVKPQCHCEHLNGWKASKHFRITIKLYAKLCTRYTAITEYSVLADHVQ